MVAQYVVAAPKVENINFGWFSSGKLVAPKEDNIQELTNLQFHVIIKKKQFYNHLKI